MKSVSDTLSTVQAKLAAYGFTPTTFPVLVSEPNEKGKRDKTPQVPWGDLSKGETASDHDDMNARGLATGERSGVIVVDVDDLTVELPSDYPKTFAVKTNRGVHRYFRAPEGIHIPTLKQFPCPGVDLRGRGGYVVCEGSGYEVAEDIAPADCPKSLLEAIAEYELARMQKEHTDHHPVDLSTPFGQQLLRQATIDAKTLPVGGPGNRDDHLWRAALTVVRSRGMPVDTAIELLNTHYAPRVSEDGRDTVSPLRVEYKCNEAARVGTWEFIPFTDETLQKMWEASRREKFGLALPEKIARRRPDPNHKYDERFTSKGMVPAGKLRNEPLTSITNILATNGAWAGVLQHDVFADVDVAINPPMPLDVESGGSFSDVDVTRVRQWFQAALGIEVGKESALDAMRAVAKDNGFHPVREYLATLPPGEDVERSPREG